MGMWARELAIVRRWLFLTLSGREHDQMRIE